MPDLVKFATSRSASSENSLKWCRYFRNSAGRLATIPWDRLIAPTTDQWSYLIPSLLDIQLCETSDGRNSLARAADYGRRVGDPQYVEAVRLFFADEGRHSEYLARYLRLCGVEPLVRSGTDFLFRRARRLLGLEAVITILLIAEVIGEVYYRAVLAATDCPALGAIFTRIIRDEQAHIRFHVERHELLARTRSRWGTRIRQALWPVLFAGACVVVWLKHRRAFRLGGYWFGRYWAEAWAGFGRASTSLVRRSASNVGLTARR